MRDSNWNDFDLTDRTDMADITEFFERISKTQQEQELMLKNEFDLTPELWNNDRDAYVAWREAHLSVKLLANAEVQSIIDNEGVINARIEKGRLQTLSLYGGDVRGWDDCWGWVESQTEAENLIKLHTLAHGFTQGVRYGHVRG